MAKPFKMVKIANGAYRGGFVENGVFKLININQESGTVNVHNDGTLATDKKRVSIKTTEYEVIQGATKKQKQQEPLMALSVEPTVELSDDEIMDKQAKKFGVLDRLTSAVIKGNVPSLIVVGPPGVGKSFGVMNQLEMDSLTDRMMNKPARYTVLKGKVTPIGLYCSLYRYSDSRNILVFDDCDDIFKDDLSLNILKGALDSGKRRISWKSNSSMLRETGTPDEFDFNGGVIFITNMKFDKVGRSAMAEHIKALRSRSLFLNLKIETQREQMLRIRQVHRDAPNGLFSKYDFFNGEAEQIMDYMWEKRDELQQINLRTALNIANLVKDSPEDWKMFAEATLMKG